MELDGGSDMVIYNDIRSKGDKMKTEECDSDSG